MFLNSESLSGMTEVGTGALPARPSRQSMINEGKGKKASQLVRFQQKVKNRRGKINARSRDGNSQIRPFPALPVPPLCATVPRRYLNAQNIKGRPLMSALLVCEPSVLSHYSSTINFFISTNSAACTRYKYTPLPKAPTKLTPLHTPQCHSQHPVHLVGVFIISCINSLHHALLDTVLSFFGRFYMSKAKVERYIINYFKRSRNNKWRKNS